MIGRKLGGTRRPIHHGSYRRSRTDGVRRRYTTPLVPAGRVYGLDRGEVGNRPQFVNDPQVVGRLNRQHSGDCLFESILHFILWVGVEPEYLTQISLARLDQP